jgi:hypothetical protein
MTIYHLGNTDRDHLDRCGRVVVAARSLGDLLDKIVSLNHLNEAKINV